MMNTGAKHDECEHDTGAPRRIDELLLDDHHPWSSLISMQEREVIARGRYAVDSPLGARPALILVDVQPSVVGLDLPILEQIDEFPSGVGATAHRAIRALARVLAAARAAKAPVIYTRLVTQNGLGVHGIRIDRKPLDANDSQTQVVRELAPETHDIVIQKQFASAFFRTPLHSLLSRAHVDTVLIGGGSTSGCVRATSVDATAHGYRVAVIEDGTFDRIQLSHAASLLDIWMKYGALLSSKDASHYLRTAAQRSHSA